MLAARPYQLEAIASLREGWREPDVLHQLVVMATGCFQRGTRVLLADGSIRQVETIRRGMRLMGADGTLRTVQSLARGKEPMYAIIPIKGELHTVNESHILTLEKIPKRPGPAPVVVDVPLRDYLVASKENKHLLKLYRSKRLEFYGQREFLPLPPYFVGLYLGDGSACTSVNNRGGWTIQSAVSITTMDREIVAEVERVAAAFGMRIRVEGMRNNKASNYYIVGDITGRKSQGRNPVSQLMKHLGINVVGKKKFIPQSYKTACARDRLEVLAGLIDTDGSLAHGCYDYISQSSRLADDVVFIARSLGLAANVAPCVKKCQTGVAGLYYRVCISGDCSIIPCRLPRKRAPVRRQKKSVLRTGFKVMPLGIGDYYGFTLDGDGRFLLADFTATHNCGKTPTFSLLAAQEEDAGRRTLILAHTDELIDQAIDKYWQFTGRRAAREKAESYASRDAMVVVASVQTMQGDLRLYTWPKDHFQTIILDEAHHSVSKGNEKILQHFAAGGAKCVGWTATSDRGDQRTLGEFFHRIAYDYGLLKAVRDGWLVRPLVKTMPVTIDLNDVKVKATSEGSDLDRVEVGKKLVPFMDAIAAAIRSEIGTEKVLIFLPSVETAQLMSEAMVKAGVSSQWVCGDRQLCPDRAKIVAAHKRGEFQALSNCMLLTEGYDDDSIHNIVCLRATKIRSLYVQIIGRSMRPLGDIVPKLNEAASAAERTEIIRSSTKPHARILEFLWLHEKHNLCSPASLVTKSDQLKELMEGKQGDLLEMEAQAERDLLAKLEAEVKKHAQKKSRTVDPLAIAAELGDVELAGYEPETARDARPMSDKQRLILAQNGIKVEAVKGFGHAHKLIGIILERHRKSLCTIRQLNFLKKVGIDARLWTKVQASQKQQEVIARWNSRRAEHRAGRKHMAPPRVVQAAAQQLELENATLTKLNGAPSLIAPELPDFSDLFGKL